MFDASKIKCPECGESYFRVGASMSTAMYFPPVYKDGVNVNPDRNTTKTACTCLNCGKYFVVRERCGEVTVE